MESYLQKILLWENFHHSFEISEFLLKEKFPYAILLFPPAIFPPLFYILIYHSLNTYTRHYTSLYRVFHSIMTKNTVIFLISNKKT